MSRRVSVSFLAVSLALVLVASLALASLGGGTALAQEDPTATPTEPPPTLEPQIDQPIDPTLSQFVAAPDSVLANGTDQALISLTLRDASGNLLTGRSVALELAAAANALAVAQDVLQALSNESGVALFRVSSNVVQSAMFNVRDMLFNTVVGALTVNFIPSGGPVDASRSTLTVSSDEPMLKADGAQAFTVTATLRDATGAPVQGKLPTLKFLPEDVSGIIVSEAQSSNANGLVTWLISATKPVTFGVIAEVDNQSFTTASMLTFISVVDAALSNVTFAVPESARVGTQVTFLVNVRDSNGNALSGQEVSVSSSRGALDSITALNAITDGSGTARFVLQSNTPGGLILNATAGGVALTPQLFTFVLPSSDPNNTTIEADIPRASVTTETIQITVTVRDSSNDPVSGVSVDLIADPQIVIPVRPIVSDVNGRAVFNVGATTDGSYTIGATIDSTPITSTVDVEFTAGPVSASKSTVTVNTSRVAVGGPPSRATITVTVRDGSNNPLSGQTVTLASSGSGDTITPPTRTTNASGVATFQVFSDTLPQTATYTATADGVELLQTVSVTYVGINSTTSTVTATPTTLVIGSGTALATVTVLGTDGLPLPNVNVTLAESGPSIANIMDVAGTITNASGQVQFSVTPISPGTTTLTATANANVLSQTVMLTFTRVDPAQSTSPSSGSGSVGSPVTVTVTARDISGNPLSGETVTLASSRPSNDTITFIPSSPSLLSSTSGSTNSNGEANFQIVSNAPGSSTFTVIAGGATLPPFTLTFTPASAATLTVVAAPNPVNTGNASTVTVTALDASSNPVSGVTISLSSDRSAVDTINTISGTTDTAGQATFEVVSQAAGTSTLTATDGTISASATLTVNTLVSASTSVVDAAPASVPVSTNSTITVIVRDSSSNPVANQLVTLGVSPSGPSLSPASALTNASGVATFTFNSAATGTFTVTATAAGVPITDNAVVTVTSPPVSPTNSTVVAAPSTVGVGVPSTVTVTVRDTSNNPIVGATVTLASSRPSNDIIVPSSAISGAGGIATFTVTSNAAGTSVLTATANSVTITNTATLTVTSGPGPDLAISKAHNGNFTVGTNGTFNIAVFNIGSSVSPGAVITVTDTLPAGLTYVSAAGPGFVCGFTAPTVTCVRTSGMLFGEVSVINLVVTPTAAGVVLNTATVALSGGPSDVNPANNTSTDAVVIDVGSSQVVSDTLSTVSANPITAPADNTTNVNVTVTVRNMSNQPVVGAQVTLQPTPNTGLTILAAPTLISDSNGQVAFVVRSSVPQIVTLNVAVSAANNVILATKPVVTFTAAGAGTISETNSTVISNFNSIPADNQTAATVTVTLRDTNNQPVPGKQVTLRANPALASVFIQPPSGTSDANGVVNFSVRASAQGQATFSAEAVDGRVFFITQTATIQFTAPGTRPVVNPQATQVAGVGAPTLIPPGTISVPTGPLEGMVVAWRLRVRQGPGLEFPILGLLAYGTKVSIVARDARGAWFQIQLENGTAWVSARWVRVSRAVRNRVPVVAAPPGTAPIIPLPEGVLPQRGEGLGVVNTFLLRVRSGPGTQFQQIGLLREGTEIVIVGVSRDLRWYLFRTAEGTAWTSALFVKLKFVNGSDRLPLLNPDGTPLF
ncbi:MAG: Ig-like domain-containing protein [Aggregatilineales bacterium]